MKIDTAISKSVVVFQTSALVFIVTLEVASEANDIYRQMLQEYENLWKNVAFCKGVPRRQSHRLATLPSVGAVP